MLYHVVSDRAVPGKLVYLNAPDEIWVEDVAKATVYDNRQVAEGDARWSVGARVQDAEPKPKQPKAAPKQAAASPDQTAAASAPKKPSAE